MYRNIDEILKDGHWRGGASVEKIDAVEMLLAVTLPADYRYFIEKYGCGSKNGLEIAGIDTLLTSDGNVLTRTILQLREYRHFPKTYIFFSDSGDGGQIVFDRGTWQVYEVYARPPKDLETQKIAESFIDFLQQRMVVMN
jgi:hypothetical protein